jgi:hypothetical protein
VPKLFLNPRLPDYFITAPEVTSATNARSYVDEYESAKVICFPNVSAGIDHKFWAKIKTGRYPALKKFSIDLTADLEDEELRRAHRRKLLAQGVDEATTAALCDQMQAIYRLIIPVYRAVFGEYSFDRRVVVWRLNTIRAENMHVDTYGKEHKLHFARMFLNLDTQPRIWHTSWRIEDMLRRANGRIAPEDIQGLSRAEVWNKLNAAFFGKNSRQFWDDQPRHIAFFDPGDVWVVDSRQVSHQIFYGRRALSIDFTVPKEHMNNPMVHYLTIADQFRREAGQACGLGSERLSAA